MKFRSLFLILFVTGLLSCSSGHDKQKMPVAETKDSIVPKENFEKGKIIEQVICKNDNSQSYAMYLPASYSTENLFPIIIAFDPHGTGKLPVSNYKDLAEKYGYIIIGSNNSKNGIAWEDSRKMAGTLFADLATRLSINMDRIYLLGFSGGARIANAITIENGGIAGVICCGAAAPASNTRDPRNNYTFLGIIGNEDFNYVEMRKYDMVDIAGHNVKHSLLTFDGKHEWPSKDVMDEAFWWLELNAMRAKKIPTDSLIGKNLQMSAEQLEAYHKQQDALGAYQFCRKTISFYDGLADLTYFYGAFKSLQNDSEIDKALRTEEMMWKKEDELKQFYNNAFQTENDAWWEKDIASLNKKIKSGKNKDEVFMYKRTLNYLSLAAYMYANKVMQENNINAAEHFCKLYVLVDPTNSEAHYLTAVVNAKQGKTKEAISSLNAAVKNGFTDVERLQSENAFNEIKNTKEFGEVVGKIKSTIKHTDS